MTVSVRNDAKRILIFNPSFLGDTVLMTPLAQCLSTLYKDSEIWICVRPESKPLVDNIPAVHGVIVYDKRNKQKGFAKSIAFIKTLRSYNFHLVLGLHLSFRSTYIIRGLKSESTTTVGFHEGVMSKTYDFRTAKYTDDAKHEVERYLNIIRCLVTPNSFQMADAKELAGKCQVSIDTTLANNITEYVATLKHSTLVGIAPFSAWKTKEWPMEGYAWLARQLTLQGHLVFLFGETRHTIQGEEFLKLCMVDVVNLIGVVDIQGAATYIQALDLLITNDTAPMHIAAAVDTHVVAMFGPTVPHLGFLPYTDKYTLFENININCRPCTMHGSELCPQGHFKCMEDIHPQRVYNAAQEVLSHV